jgi:hypothetical protein
MRTFLRNGSDLRSTKVGFHSASRRIDMRHRSLLATALVAAGLLFVPLVLAQDGGDHAGMGMGGAKGMTCEICSLHMREAKNLAAIRDLLKEAKAAAEKAGANAAVAKIDQALAKIEERHQEIHAEMKEHVAKDHGGKMPAGMTCPLCPSTASAQGMTVVNAYCPMTGKKLDTTKLDASRTREFEGKMIGFCCPHCPPSWDKLSDAEKEARLKKAMSQQD